MLHHFSELSYFSLLQCSVILAIMLSYFNELNHSSYCSVQSFFTVIVLMHPRYYCAQLFLIYYRA
jgi:hypothetical protein